MAPASHSLPLHARNDLTSFYENAGHKRLFARDASNSWKPGQGSVPAASINNKGIQFLFALIGMGMVLTAIWFFFWAKNGGFQFKQGDWDEYKSTVLRRKGPDGRTLSNATRSTKLGGGSVVHGQKSKKGKKKGRKGAHKRNEKSTDTNSTTAYYNDMDSLEAGQNNAANRSRGHDDDLRAYRHEKPARVGGLNREAEGTQYDWTNSDPSEIMTRYTDDGATDAGRGKPDKAAAKRAAKAEAAAQKAEAKEREAVQKEIIKRNKAKAKEAAKAHKASQPKKPLFGGRGLKKPEPTHSRPAERAQEEMSEAYTASYSNPTQDSYYNNYRPAPVPASPRHARHTSEQDGGPRHGSPRHSGAARPSTRHESDTGTKVYEHRMNNSHANYPVPSGGRTVPGGFRRGGGARRDSLSDSDGETSYS